jgi:hypothetical protein
MSGYPEAIRTLPVRAYAAPEVRSLAALLLPSFGVIVFTVTLLEVLFLSHGAAGLLRDSDTGWHIRNGEAIVETMAVPRVDRFSYTREGERWVAWEWLSDVVLGGVHRIGGLPAVALFAGLVIAATVWASAAVSLSLGSNLFVTAGSVVVVLGITSLHWLARPHIFSWLFALIFLAVAEQERLGRGGALYFLPILACLWTNMHASFLFGPGILFIYAIGEWLAGVGTLACERPLAGRFAPRLSPFVRRTLAIPSS